MVVIHSHNEVAFHFYSCQNSVSGLSAIMHLVFTVQDWRQDNVTPKLTKIPPKGHWNQLSQLTDRSEYNASAPGIAHQDWLFSAPDSSRVTTQTLFNLVVVFPCWKKTLLDVNKDFKRKGYQTTNLLLTSAAIDVATRGKAKNGLLLRFIFSVPDLKNKMFFKKGNNESTH